MRRKEVWLGKYNHAKEVWNQNIRTDMTDNHNLIKKTVRTSE
jgi:hypothetical protein